MKLLYIRKKNAETPGTPLIKNLKLEAHCAITPSPTKSKYIIFNFGLKKAHIKIQLYDQRGLKVTSLDSDSLTVNLFGLRLL